MCLILLITVLSGCIGKEPESSSPLNQSLPEKLAKQESSAPAITPPVTVETRPIRRASRAVCEINRPPAPSSPKEYTLAENQQITLDSGEKVALIVAYNNIRTGEPEAAVKVEFDGIEMEGYLGTNNTVRIGNVMAALKGVPGFGTAVISFSSLPKRTQPVIFGYLIRFGSFMDNTELKEVAEAFETAYENATHGSIQLCITVGGSVNLPPEDEAHRYSEVRSSFPWLRDDSLRRVWYGDKGDLGEAVAAAYSSGFSDSYDVLIVLSEAQYYLPGEVAAGGFASGFSRAQGNSSGIANLIAVIQPLEINYLTGKDYRIENRTLYQLSDVFLHEMGHHMGLGHNGCITGDVMSICNTRRRPGIEDTFYGIYSQCSLDWISGRYLPAFMRSEPPPYNSSPCP